MWRSTVTYRLMSNQSFRACVFAAAISAAIGFGVWHFILVPLKHAARRADGGNEAHKMYYACLQYCAENNGLFPPLDRELGRLMFDRRVMSSQFNITGYDVTQKYDATVPVKRDVLERDDKLSRNIDIIDDHSWWYLGYEVKNEDEMLAFAQAYRREAIDEGHWPDTLRAFKDGSWIYLKKLARPEMAGFSFPKLRELPKAASEAASIPVFIERPGHYQGYTGGWVTYLDGGRRFLEYPSEFPMTESTILALREIDALGGESK
jgi:hypothetical protein